jgi:Fe2+ transport system protein FeoA
MKLSECTEGTYKIVRFPQGTCGDRLIYMGILRGSTITVTNKSLWGPIVLRHNRNTLSIGRGMAYKIEVDKI